MNETEDFAKVDEKLEKAITSSQFFVDTDEFTTFKISTESKAGKRRNIEMFDKRIQFGDGEFFFPFFIRSRRDVRLTFSSYFYAFIVSKKFFL